MTTKVHVTGLTTLIAHNWGNPYEASQGDHKSCNKPMHTQLPSPMSLQVPEKQESNNAGIT